VGRDTIRDRQDLERVYNGIVAKNWGPKQVYNAMSRYRGGEHSSEMKKFVLETFGKPSTPPNENNFSIAL
jgi:hypothetical protein